MKKIKKLNKLLSLIATTGAIPFIVNASNKNTEQSTSVELKEHKVTVSATEGGRIYVTAKNWTKIAHSKYSLAEDLVEGTEIKIELKINDGYRFDSWAGDSSLITKNEKYNFYVATVGDSDIELAAVFKSKESANYITVGINEYKIDSTIDPNLFCFKDRNAIAEIPLANGGNIKVKPDDIVKLKLESCKPDALIIGDKFLFACTNLEELKIDSLNQIMVIGNNFLDGCEHFDKEYKLPNSLIQIGDYFMAYCENFNKKLKMPEKLELIGEDPFFDCKKLNIGHNMTNIINNDLNVLNRNRVSFGAEYIDLADNIDPNIFCKGWWDAVYLAWYNIDFPLFDGSTLNERGYRMTSLELCSCDHNVKNLGNRFLYNCCRLKYLDLSGLNNIETIGDEFLYECNKLDNEVILPKTLKSFGECFMMSCDCYNQQLILPNGITCINSEFMRGCRSFNNNLYIPNSVTTIKDRFLHNCVSYNQDLKIPDSVTSIGDDFLCDCHCFRTPLVLPNSIRSIGDSFMSCCFSYNEPIFLPRWLKTIGNLFMCKCYNFNNTLFIPKSVESIGDSFMHCYTLFEEKNLCNLSSAKITWGVSKTMQEIGEWILMFTAVVAFTGILTINTMTFERKTIFELKSVKNVVPYKYFDFDNEHEAAESAKQLLRMDPFRYDRDNNPNGIKADFVSTLNAHNEACDRIGLHQYKIIPGALVEKVADTYGILDYKGKSLWKPYDYWTLFKKDKPEKIELPNNPYKNNGVDPLGGIPKNYRPSLINGGIKSGGGGMREDNENINVINTSSKPETPDWQENMDPSYRQIVNKYNNISLKNMQARQSVLNNFEGYNNKKEASRGELAVLNWCGRHIKDPYDENKFYLDSLTVEYIIKHNDACCELYDGKSCMIRVWDFKNELEKYEVYNPLTGMITSGNDYLAKITKW
ncbi:MAG: leucine-rich repeat protein [Malacoplasma sp.]|nr:leucine-rich repeat protein [Malacoplasma sp.]